MTGPRSKSKSLVALMLVASTVASAQAQAQMSCQALFRENATSKDLQGTLAHIRTQEGYERIYDRMARWEKMGDVLRGWNGRTHAKHVLKRRALLRGIEASLRRGDAGDVMNKIRPVYRGVEVEYGRLLQLDKQITELESGLSADGNRVDVQVDANVKLASLKLERTKRLSRFGTRYAEYVEIRGYLEKAIATEKMINSDQYMDTHGMLESLAPVSKTDAKKDPLSKEARLELYIETAKTADSKLSVESLKSWLPEFEPLQRRPSLEEIKAYFKSHPEARNAFLRYHAVEELFTFLKFFVNRGAGILKAGTYRLPESIKGVPVRKPIEDAIGISQDVDLVESYGHLVQEVNRAVVSTHEKYALLLQKAAGAPPEKFYETFARMPLAADVFTELKTYTKQKDPMVHRHMVDAEAVRTKKGDLPEEGYFSVADRAYRYALAFVAGTMVGYFSGIGDDTIDAIWGWLFGMKKEIEGELAKTNGQLVPEDSGLGFADLEGMLGAPSEDAEKEAPKPVPAPKKKEKTAAPPANENKPAEKKQELVPVHLPAPAAPAAPAPAEKTEAPKEEAKPAEKPVEKPQAEKPKIPDIKKGKEDGAAEGKPGEKNIVSLDENGNKKSPNAQLLRPGKKDQAKEADETSSTTEGEKPAQPQAQPKAQPKSEAPQAQLEGTATVAPPAPAPAAPSNAASTGAPAAAGSSLLTPAPVSGSDFVPTNLQPTSRTMNVPANQPRRSTTTPGNDTRTTTTPRSESPATTTPRSLPVARPMNATTEITAPAAPQKPAIEFKLAQPPAAKAISETATEKAEAKPQAKPATNEPEKKRVRLGVDPQNKDGFLFKPVKPKGD